MIHCGIGCHAHTVDLFFRKMSAPAHFMDHWIDRFFDHCILDVYKRQPFVKLLGRIASAFLAVHGIMETITVFLP